MCWMKINAIDLYQKYMNGSHMWWIIKKKIQLKKPPKPTVYLSLDYCKSAFKFYVKDYHLFNDIHDFVSFCMDSKFKSLHLQTVARKAPINWTSTVFPFCFNKDSKACLNAISWPWVPNVRRNWGCIHMKFPTITSYKIAHEVIVRNFSWINASSASWCKIDPRGLYGVKKGAGIDITRRSILHYSDVIMSAMASQITGASIDYSTICSGTDHRKHQSPASLACVRRIHQWPVNSPHKGQ